MVGPKMISILLQLSGSIAGATRGAFNELELPSECEYDELDHGMPYSAKQRRALFLLSSLGGNLHRIELPFLPTCATKTITTHCKTPRHLSVCVDYERKATSFCSILTKCGRDLEVLKLEVERLLRRDVVLLADYCTNLHRLKLKFASMDYPLGEHWVHIGSNLSHLEAGSPKMDASAQFVDLNLNGTCFDVLVAECKKLKGLTFNLSLCRRTLSTVLLNLFQQHCSGLQALKLIWNGWCNREHCRTLGEAWPSAAT